MNFELDTEQQMLRDSVRRYIEKSYSFETRTALMKSGGGDHWRTFADGGWLAVALPEACGGLGGSLIDACLIAHELGRGLVIEPYLGCGVLATQTLLAAGTSAQCEALVPDLAMGNRKLALAYSEAETRGLAVPVRTRAERVAGGYRLHGVKTLVLGGAEADGYLVSARFPDTNHVALFLVDAQAPGLERGILPLHDGTRAAELLLDGVEVEGNALLGSPEKGLSALRQGLTCGIAVLCAELIGVMERAIELTADYLKVRQQFGVAIGSFQALQHRMADMAAELEVARSMLYALLASIENDDAAARARTVSQAKALIGRAARYVSSQGIQL
ncbi:MAG TPA: acyl-CoA dehydrogenase, partial [Lysobacter sp.]